MSVTLHGFHYSVYVRIVRIVLAEKSIPHRHVEIDITRPRDTEYLQLHPFGKVPTLVHDEFVLYETAAITRYLDEAFPGPALQPSQPQQRARMTQIMSMVDAYLYRPLVRQYCAHRVFRPAFGVPADEAEVHAGLELSKPALDAVEVLIASGPIAGGEIWSLADFHLAAMIAFFVAGHEGAAIVAGYPRLSAWWRIIRNRPSVRDTDAGWPARRAHGG